MQLARSRVDVDLGAVAHNARTLRRLVGVPIMGVVKADGYGHGALPIARTLAAAGVERLAVATVGEGLELRQGGISLPILVLGGSAPEEVEPALRYRLTLAVFDRPGSETVARVSRSMGIPAVVHVKVDTGMGRLGLASWVPDHDRVVAPLTGTAGVRIEGVFTHLASADEEDPSYSLEQIRRFERVVQVLEERTGSRLLRHVANSAAALRIPAARFDMVRIGLALYGLEPFPGALASAGLLPALRWTTQVAQVKTLPPGIGVSYGRTYRPETPLRVAVLPVGYADGFNRLLSNRGEVLIRGRRVPVLGRVCMNLTIVGEVGAEIVPGEEVVLLGDQDGERISAEEMASRRQTIAYEVVTGISPRVPRTYTGGDVQREWGG